MIDGGRQAGELYRWTVAPLPGKKERGGVGAKR